MHRVFYIMLLLLIITGCSGGIMDVKQTSYDDIIKSGWTEYNQGKFDDAYQLFLDAKDYDDKRPEAYIGSGWSLLRRQHPDSSIVVFRAGFDYITSLADTVDVLCGLSGSYLAAGENTNIINLFKKYTVSSYEDVFPLKNHDFFIDTGDIEIVKAMAFYRLKIYSSTEQPDPDNAVYHLNQALYTPYTYTDSQALMEKITEYLNQSGSGFY